MSVVSTHFPFIFHPFKKDSVIVLCRQQERNDFCVAHVSSSSKLAPCSSWNRNKNLGKRKKSCKLRDKKKATGNFHTTPSSYCSLDHVKRIDRERENQPLSSVVPLTCIVSFFLLDLKPQKFVLAGAARRNSFHVSI